MGLDNLTQEETDAVRFAIESDIEILSNSIQDSDAGTEWKREYSVLKSAYKKLFE